MLYYYYRAVSHKDWELPNSRNRYWSGLASHMSFSKPFSKPHVMSCRSSVQTSLRSVCTHDLGQDSPIQTKHTPFLDHALSICNVCNRCLLFFPFEIEIGEEQEYIFLDL